MIWHSSTWTHTEKEEAIHRIDRRLTCRHQRQSKVVSTVGELDTSRQNAETITALLNLQQTGRELAPEMSFTNVQHIQRQARADAGIVENQVMCLETACKQQKLQLWWPAVKTGMIEIHANHDDFKAKPVLHLPFKDAVGNMEPSVEFHVDVDSL